MKTQNTYYIIWHTQRGWTTWKLRLWFRIPPGHGCLCVVSVLCCQVEVSATSWSVVQRSPTDCRASLCVIYKPQELGGRDPRWVAASQQKKKYTYIYILLFNNTMGMSQLKNIVYLHITQTHRNLNSLNRNCHRLHGSGNWSSASELWGPGSIPDDPVRNLWWKNWQWNRFLSRILRYSIIEQVTDFKYLGYCISEFKSDLEDKLQTYNKINGAIRRHFGKQINKETKLRIHNITAKAALKFGSEA